VNKRVEREWNGGRKNAERETVSMKKRGERGRGRREIQSMKWERRETNRTRMKGEERRRERRRGRGRKGGRRERKQRRRCEREKRECEKDG
jgi:hypothetical protein